MINTTTGGVPRFLTTQFDARMKDIAEKAVALYLRVNKITPKKFSKINLKLRYLHPFLCEFEQQFHDIPADQIKTTEPRTLISHMNTYINRWKKDELLVQQKIEALPASRDESGEVDPTSNADKTVSDHASQDQEEAKDEKPELPTKVSAFQIGQTELNQNELEEPNRHNSAQPTSDPEPPLNNQPQMVFT